MNENVTINKIFSLPSKGLIYGETFDPVIKVRSMTVADEMKRISQTDYPYKNMSEIIQSCLLTDLPVNVYDMCLGDYQYLLYKIRTVTHGSKYAVSITCPTCFEQFTHIIDLDELKVNEYDESLKEFIRFVLPVSGRTIEIKFQTPKDLDSIEIKKKSYKKDFPEFSGDPSFMLNIASVIKSIDGEPVNPMTINTLVKNMDMADALCILRNMEKLNRGVGVNIDIMAKCPGCARDIKTSFRYTNEFFRPTIYQ